MCKKKFLKNPRPICKILCMLWLQINEEEGAGSVSSFLGKGGERIGLAVEEVERLGLVLVLSIFNCTAVSRGVPS